MLPLHCSLLLDVPGNQKDVAGAEFHGAVLEGHDAAVRMAEADLHAVVKVKSVGGNIGDAPALSGQAQQGKVQRQIIDPILNNIVLASCHVTKMLLSSCHF